MRYTNGTSQGDCNHENITVGDVPIFAPSNFVPSTIDAVYAFAYALHNMTAEECNYTLCDAILETSSGKIKGELFREYLRAVHFPGVSQDVVAFDENQDLKDGGYDIINLQPVNDSDTMLFKHKLVGSWVSITTHVRICIWYIFTN